MSVLLILSLLALINATRDFSTYNFEAYVKEFGKSYSRTEVMTRQQTFYENLKKIQAHNAQGLSWRLGVNQFTDHTAKEMKMYLGLDKAQLHQEHLEWVQRQGSETFESSSFGAWPSSVDWRDKNIISPVKDQGRCGSCWTFGTTETIESYWALATGQLVSLSEQQILDCCPNPNNCGGTGGCGGGTAQIAMDKLIEMGGHTTEWMYPYISYFGNAQQCVYNSSTRPFAKLKGWKRLPPNKYEPVMEHLANKGPLIINVDASTWHMYEGGVFDGCNQTSPDVDHIVQLVGYGTDRHHGDYWLVRNSWSPAWGELGYIRLKRSSTPPCGIDVKPGDGDGCNGGPPTVQVCGTCGVVYDSTYPEVDTSH